ncbi:p97 protein, putative [Eimeria brunetti]|uniref:p97 protein, putative n=1 Tax=Eimeria brunetti TaxID=51314 RepID=U6LMB4_9EIME|nr:p97 protein, putative [Eimeria brunetti]
MSEGRPRKTEQAWATLRAWRAWRSKHRMPLEEALKNPLAWRLYKEMLQHNGSTKTEVNTYEEWLEMTKCTQRWVAWKRAHPKPLREVLADPEGWALFYAMKQEKGVTVPPTYEEWLQHQDQRRSMAYEAWVQWRRQHLGPLTEVLADPEGWALYKAKRASQDAKLPETHEEWCRDPNTIKAMAMEAWTTWRRAHPGALRKVLADPEGYKLYRHMLESSGKQADPTYEEWRERRASASWQAWRREHPGPLVRVLADPCGWRLYRSELEQQQLKNGVKGELPETYEEWLQLPPQQRLVSKKDKQLSPSSESESKKGSNTANGRGKTAGGSLNRGKQRSAAMSAWLAWLGKQNSTDLNELLQDPEGWELYRAAMSKPGRPFPETYEGFKILEAASKAWSAWREEHHGNPVNVLKDPEGWKLYSALMHARGVQIPETYAEWLQMPEQGVIVAATEWVEWRERRPQQPFMELLSTEEEGWKLFRAFMEAIGVQVPATFKEWEPEAVESLMRAKALTRPASRRFQPRRIEVFARKQAIAEIRGEPFPATYEEWLRTPRLRLLSSPVASWTLWRRRHPGHLGEVLKDPEGWDLYVKKLQAAGSHVPESYEEWLESPQWKRQEATINWASWRKKNKGPMVEVLQDPEGWKLYSAMKLAVSGTPCEQFEDWQNSIGARKKALREWLAWKKLHPGPRYTILSDPLGWRLYRAAFAGQKALPETYAEYIQARQPTITWLAWRRQHPGPLVSVLADDDGWTLYKDHMQATGNSVPQDYEEWAETHRTVATNGNSRRGKRTVSPREEAMRAQQVIVQ